MKSVQLLLDLAREKCHGNEAKLAEAIGVPRNRPHEWRTGKQAMSAENAVLLCDYLGMSGEETREWVAVAIIENPKNSSKAELLRRALFACWVLGVGSLLTTPNDASAETQQTNEYVNIPRSDAVTGFKPTIYTLSRIFSALLRGLRSSCNAVRSALDARSARPLFSTT